MMAEGDITVSNQAKAWMLGGIVDLDTDTIKVALTNGYSFDADNNHGYSNFSANEITATGYSAGGESLTGLTITTNDTGDYAMWDAGNVTWTSLATTSIDMACIYDDTLTTPVAKGLLASMEIGTNSNGGNYTINWNAGGILQLGQRFPGLRSGYPKRGRAIRLFLVNMWQIFYADGSTFDGYPQDAPGLGVVVIVQEHEVAGERPYLQHMTDYYIWLGERWLGCDLFRLWQYIFVEKFDFPKVALAGQTVSNDLFKEIGKKARALRDQWHDPTNL